MAMTTSRCRVVAEPNRDAGVQVVATVGPAVERRVVDVAQGAMQQMNPRHHVA